MKQLLINEKRLINTFLDLVQIDSPSGEEHTVSDFIIRLLSKKYKNITKDRTGNIVIKVKGIGNPILLSAHMDTVEPGRGIIPIIKNGVIKPKGKTILGMDNKSGIALIIELLLSLQENQATHPPIEVIFTVNEENGCIGAKQIDFRKLKAKRGLTFDYYSYPIGTIVSKSFSYITVDIEVFGKEAHAGNVLEHISTEQHGINAISIAAKAVSKFPKRRISHDTSCNFGTIHGGNVRNSVPNKVSIQAEIRTFSHKNGLLFANKIKDTFIQTAQQMGGTAVIKIDSPIQGFAINKTKSLFLKEIEAHYKKNQIKISHTIGGSDANIFNNAGIETLDLSVGGYGEHTLSEQIKVTDLEKITNLIYTFLTNHE